MTQTNNFVKTQLERAKNMKGASGFYQAIWDSFQLADRDNKSRIIRAYPELLDVAKEPGFSAERTGAMAERAGREFE